MNNSVYLYSNASDSKEMITFVKHHFADLCFYESQPFKFKDIPTITEVYLNSLGLIKSKNCQDKLLFSARFPKISVEPFLYLSLCFSIYQELFSYPFVFKDTCFTVVGSFNRINSPINNNSINSQNTLAISKSGNDLECVTTTAIVVSSHINGASGVIFSDFLRYLCIQLSEEYYPDSLLDMTMTTLNIDLTVPFLAPPSDDDWPIELRNIKGSLFSTIIRTRNSDRIDFYIPNVLTGECKNYSSKLPSNVLCDCIDRIPSNSRMHLIITNSIPEYKITYCITKALKKKRANVYTIEKYNNDFKLVEKFKRVESYKKVVIIIAILSLNGLDNLVDEETEK